MNGPTVPASRWSRGTRPARRLVPASLLALLGLLGTVAAGCSGGAGPADKSPTAASTSTTSAAPTPTQAVAAPRPEQGACYLLTYRQALAPTNRTAPRSCGQPHTAVTYRVGALDSVVDGHLLAVDSQHVQDQVTEACPAALGRYLGGTPEQLRLTSLRAAWFTPTLAQSDAGADWYRCDVVAPSGTDRLAPLTGRLHGVLATAEGRDRYGRCGTAEPGTKGFEQVICSRPHSWRAIASYDVAGRGYPGAAALRRAAGDRCQDAAREVASDTLDYQWGYDWPTRQQWQAGQHYGLCWAPEG